MWVIILSNSAWAQNKNLQLQVGNAVSVYSEKAYKREKGRRFEAVGNVVIISAEHTLYGEKASIDLATNKAEVEGNVRLISPGLNIYGSAMKFSFNANDIVIDNARVITQDYNLIANSLKQTAKRTFEAQQAQFSTCKDCEESWSLFGENIFIELDRYIQVYHALVKVKGVSVLYFPYVFLPIKTQRESGLLFPTVSSTFNNGANEGIIYEQPVFWNIDTNKDMTFTPRFIGTRGYGLDHEYRHVFGARSWLNFDNRFVVDSIYVPQKTSREVSGETFFRSFSNFEGHWHSSNNLTGHLKLNYPKDLDMYSDFADYMREFSESENPGLHGFLNYRREDYILSLEADVRRNNAVENPLSFDKNFVQTLPMLSASFTPKSLLEKERFGIEQILVGADLSLARFAPWRDEATSSGIRNAIRLDSKPYLHLNFDNLGPVRLAMHYTFDSQIYRLPEEEERDFFKGVSIFETSASFNYSKIYGKATVERYDREDISRNEEASDFIGNLPQINEGENLDFELVYKNSYKHNQEYKLAHYYTSSSTEYGNQEYLEQISSADGWFDYEDALKEDYANLGINDVRTNLPLLNTLEFQWNNTLTKKSLLSSKESLFNYNRVGFFNISQGLVLKKYDESVDLEDRLTRLLIDAQYNFPSFSVGIREFYFHSDSAHKTELAFRKNYDNFQIFSAYNYNDLDNSQLKTLKIGGGIRFFGEYGLSFVEDYNLNNREKMRQLYKADYMPNSDCWILSLRYRKNPSDERVSFNFVFDFGNSSFAQYKQDYFNNVENF